MSDVNIDLARTMLCPKKCDLLVTRTSSNPNEFKMNLKGSIFLLISLMSAYVLFNEPPYVFDILPIDVPTIFFGIIAILSLTISLHFSKGRIIEYVCPSCKGVHFDINRLKVVRNGKVTKSSSNKHGIVLDLLNGSSELSELHCPSCSKDLNSFNILYRLEHKSSSGSFVKDLAIETAVDSLFGGVKEMQIEGCKNCKSLWLDRSNRLDIFKGRIVSTKRA